MRFRTISGFLFFTLFAFVILLLAGCVTLVSDLPIDTAEKADGQFEKIGTVNAELTNWNWFFQKSADERKDLLKQLVLDKAAERFGEDVIVKTESIEGRWSPASLLMLFNTLGFVEESYLMASVWRLVPEPEPEARSVNYGIRYVVIPEENYTSPSGFMLVEYKTRKQLNSELIEGCKAGKIAEKDLPKKQAQLPDTGKIFITLGREDITNAISRWFSFTCSHNNRIIFKKRGIEDIPYVYGTDKFWWNDMSYNVGPSWDGELLLSIEDSYQNKIYNFRIVKELYELPEE